VATHEQKREQLNLNAAAEAALRTYRWPGNVRELENKIRRAVLLASGNSVRPTDLGLDVAAAGVRDLMTIRDQAERQALMASLSRHQGNVTRAARELGVSRTTFYGLLRKHEIEQQR
jgi:two-component system NtrC family response regulator